MKKAVFFVVIFLSVFALGSLLVTTAVFAQQSEFEQAVAESETQTNLEGFSYRSLLNTAMGLNQFMGGCTTKDCGGSTLLLSDSAIGGAGQMIAFTFEPSASFNTYVADVMQNMNIIAPPVYAQGIGFSALQPVLGLWKIFRDISYVFFVFIFLAIGLAIMFRQSLGGQTAVTVQQALPRIIVALLAVSFSYAIAGLMIDLMWIVMFFLVTMFNGSGLLAGTGLDNTNILNYDIFGLFWAVITNNFAGQAAGVIGDFVKNSFGNEGLNQFLGSVGQGLTNVLGTLIIFVAILYAMFRTFFSLIKVYLEIILLIVFAPIILMMGAINGNAFGNWFKSLVANLAVFPVLLVFIIIGFMLINQGGNNLQSQLQGGGFIPPFIPGRSNAGTIGIIGGIAAIMLLPEVVSIVGKYKPSSIFEEFGGKAWANAMKGRSAGVRMGLLGATTVPATIAGAALGYKLAKPGKGTSGALLGGAAGLVAPTLASGAPWALRKGRALGGDALAIARAGAAISPAFQEYLASGTPPTQTPPSPAQKARPATGGVVGKAANAFRNAYNQQYHNPQQGNPPQPPTPQPPTPQPPTTGNPNPTPPVVPPANPGNGV